MVNRVLIRIKVVQLLYSYLLTRSEFRIDSAPETASRDKRFAYKVYIDLLLLLIELSGYSIYNGKVPLVRADKKLALNKVAKALNVNETMRQAMLRDNDMHAFDAVVQDLHNRIVASSIYADHRKKVNTELGDDVQFWIVILETVIAKDDKLKDIFRELGDFTNQGYEMGIQDVCDTLRSYADSKQLLQKAKADLTASLDKAYELYLDIFTLIIDLTREQERRMENAKQKHLASSEDLNPNTKLIDNQLVSYLLDNESFKQKLEEYPLERYSETSPLIRTLLDQILASDLYKNYISEPVTDLQKDCDFWREALKTIILPSDAFAEDLEDRSVFWNDDLQIMGTFVLKTIRQIAASEGKAIEMLPKFKDLEDENFGPELFMYSVKNQELYRSYIDRFIEPSHWDPKRLAYMDIVIMTAAIAEIINYPAIPVPVSVNEYVEIANQYSTDKSGGFINGILYSVIKYLNAEGIINKN